MPRFSANFKAVLQSYGSLPAPLFTVMDVGWNGVAAARYTEDVPSSALMVSAASPRIQAGKVATITSQVSQRVGDLGRQTHTVSLIDTDGAITSLLTGRYDQRRASVVLRWGLPGIAETDWFTAFTGVLNDYAWTPGSVELQTSTDDRTLRGSIPHRQILKGWAPYAPASALGKYLPIVLGTHNSQSLGGTGMIPLIPYSLDATNGYLYVVSLTGILAVNRVFKAGAQLTAGTSANQWQASTVTLGGNTFTSVKISSPSPVLTDQDVITADVDGVTDTLTSAGNLLSSPADQLRWLLNHVVYNDTDGATAYSNAPVDNSAFGLAAAYLSAFRQEGSAYVGGAIDQIAATSYISDWLRSNLMIRARWSNLGLLGIFALDHRWAPYYNDYWFTGDELDRNVSFKTASEGLASRIQTTYQHDQANSKYWGALEVQDLARWQVEKITESYDLLYAAARAS